MTVREGVRRNRGSLLLIGLFLLGGCFTNDDTDLLFGNLIGQASFSPEEVSGLPLSGETAASVGSGGSVTGGTSARSAPSAGEESTRSTGGEETSPSAESAMTGGESALSSEAGTEGSPASSGVSSARSPDTGTGDGEGSPATGGGTGMGAETSTPPQGNASPEMGTNVHRH
ncbi:MAG: hypothetical protein D6795_05545 [Deltaproteobacteria bacterium]|nr:MAG: hypothetical protein D6795_05545 [Deltaproteobacteria bacterium]